MPFLDPFRVGNVATAWFHCRMQQFLRQNTPDQVIQAEVTRWLGVAPTRMLRPVLLDTIPKVMLLEVSRAIICYIGQTPSTRSGAQMMESYYRPGSPSGVLGETGFMEYTGSPIVDAARAFAGRFSVPIIFSGYSMGGGLAAACAAQWKNREQADTVTMISFGGVRAGAQRFETFIQRVRTTRWMNVGDPIPLIVPRRSEIGLFETFPVPLNFRGEGLYAHSVPGYVLRDDSITYAEETGMQLSGSFAGNITWFLLAGTSEPASEHALTMYETRLFTHAQNQLAVIGDGGIVGGADDDWSDSVGGGDDNPPPAPRVPPAVVDQIVVPAIPALPQGGMPNDLGRIVLPNLLNATPPPQPPASVTRPFYAARMLGSRKWAVYYAGLILVGKISRKRARHTARRLNESVFYLQSVQNSSSGGLIAAINAELAAA